MSETVDLRGRVLDRLEGRFSGKQRGRLRQRVRRLVSPAWLGTLRRVTPLSRDWGLDRGTPVDRHYIEQFLRQQCGDIKGTALEIRDASYTRRFGTAVERSEVLDIDPTNSEATILGDVAAADAVESESIDCYILTQTLGLVPDFRAAIAHSHRILRPGGVLLATLPGLCRVERPNPICSDYWRFTTASCELLFGEAFGADHISVRSYGNVLAAIAFLSGMSAEELSKRELEFHDGLFPVVVTVRAEKAIASGRPDSTGSM